MDKAVIKSLITMAITILVAFFPPKAQAASKWSVNPADYRYDMSLYFDMTLGASGEHVDFGEYEIASFVNDECRGVATSLPNVDGCLYMRIRSNQESGEIVTFKIRNRTSGETTDVEGISLTFESDKAIGLPSDPYHIVLRRYFNVTVQASEGGSVIFDNGRYEEGATLDITAVPDEGYHFVAWSDGNTEASRTITVSDNIDIVASFEANIYNLTYMVDGEVYKTVEIAYGSAITPEAAPEKEGYTFTGWEGLLETMPAQDVNVVAEYKANIYKLTYMVEGEVYKTVEIAYGSAITPEAAPEKEGYTFTGWKGLPETMPAQDVNVVAEYKANIYKLTVYLDGEIYYETELEMGAPIDIPEPQLPETKVFNGWEEDVPATMPAHDMEIHGTTSLVSSIGTVIADENVTSTIYSITGRLLFNNTSLEEASQKLPYGIYIVNGRKMVLGQK